MATALSSYPVDLIADPATSNWLERALGLFEDTGFAIVPDIVPEEDRLRTRSGFDAVRLAQETELAADPARLQRARGDRELRVLMKYDPFFLRFLEYPALLAVIDHVLSPTATLRFQQGTVLRGGSAAGPWHMNFRRVLNGYPAALEVGFAIDQIEPGSYHFAMRSQQQTVAPATDTLEVTKRTFTIPAGAMFIFDGTLWHREGAADFDGGRHLVMHQFVPHFVKPHVDYVRALGASFISTLPARTRRLLGWDSRVPASLDEFYADPADRLYLSDQG